MINLKKINNQFLTFLPPGLALYLLPVSILAQTTTTATSAAPEKLGQLLINLSKDFPNILYWLNGLCMVLGVTFLLLAFFKLKHLADFRTMSGGQQDVGKAFMLIALGAIFLWMPFIINVMTYSIFGNTVSGLRSKYPIEAAGGNRQYYVAFFQLMMIIGLVSFIRGWLILSSMAKHQSQPGTMGKAITHIIAGLFLYHLQAVMKIFEASMGQTFLPEGI